MFDLYDNDFDKAFDEAVDEAERKAKAKRLIDADELIELIDDDIAALDNDIPQIAYDVCLCTLKMVKQYIKGLPTIEAEPIKHGRWLPSDKGDCMYTCSECGFFRDAYILEENAYCPRCGADMREVEE